MENAAKPTTMIAAGQKTHRLMTGCLVAEGVGVDSAVLGWLEVTKSRVPDAPLGPRGA